FFSSRRRHTRFSRDWSSDVCSSDLAAIGVQGDGIRLGEIRVHLDLIGHRSHPAVGLYAVEMLGKEVRHADLADRAALLRLDQLRSEERRVGKGGGAWSWPNPWTDT